jgi:hypothetical protein
VVKPQVVMRQAVLFIGLFLVLAPSLAAQKRSTSWLRGAWEGTGYQTDDNTTWAMKVTARALKVGRRAFLIDYPSLNCGGRWKLLNMNQRRARFREVLDHGQDQCSDKGLVTIERIGRQLIFLYANQGGRKITASAVLNRRSSAGSP